MRTCAVRHRLDVVELRAVAGHLDDADRSEDAVAVLRVRVPRIEGDDAVHVERVGVDVGREAARPSPSTRRPRPSSSGAACRRARHWPSPASRSGRAAQRDGAVGADLGRDGWWAARSLRRRADDHRENGRCHTHSCSRHRLFPNLDEADLVDAALGDDEVAVARRHHVANDAAAAGNDPGLELLGLRIEAHQRVRADR